MRFAPLAAALLFSSFAATDAPASARESEAAALTVALIKPVERRWPETIPASGWLKPWHEAVIAAEVGGLRVTDVLVDVGSVVSKGQALARLADASVRAELRKEEASLAIARAELAKALANADRARKVQGSGALSAEKVTDYLYAEQTAAATVESAEAALENQKVRLAQTIIVAVDDGLISARSVQLGTVVGSGTEMFRLVRQRRVEWQAEVPARHLSRVRSGLAATILESGERRLTGVVRLVGPTVNPDNGRAIVYVALSSETPPPAGLFVTGQIELETWTALTVPDTALVLRDGLAYVFAVGPDRRATRMRVEIGRRRDGEVEILSGVTRSTEVIRSGGAFLSDGALVRVEGLGQ